MTYTANVQQRNYLGLGLLFLAALPWVGAVDLLPVLLAVLLAWGSRQIAGARQYAAYSSIYAGVSVFLLPPFDFPAVFFNRITPFFLVVALGFLLGSALDGVQDGTFWAWLAPLLLFLAFPSAWGALAILGLALLAALEKQKDTVGSKLYLLEPQHLWRLGGVVVLVAALGFLLPRVGNFEDPTQAATLAPIATPALEKPLETPSATPTQNPPQPTRRIQQTNDNFFAITTALLFVGVVILAGFLFRSKLEQRKKNPNNSLWDLIPIIAVLILALAILLLALNAGSGSPANGQQSGTISSSSPVIEQGNPAFEDASDSTTNSNRASPWLPIMMAALMLLLLYWLYRRASKQFALPPEPEPDLIPNPVPTQTATNRVRQAYLTFLELATRWGLPRTAAETPLEFARRFGKKFVPFASAAQTLTELYEPVRYGQLAAETHALAAEDALLEIQQS